jgi:hypothetical protein
MNSATSVFSFRINEASHQSPDPILTGQQLLDMAGKSPSDQFLVYQLLRSGQMEGLRPDETVDLRQSGVEKFLTFESDRSFYFTLDGRKFEWPAAVITGRKLKDLAQVDPTTYEVWQEVRGENDRTIGDQEVVSLEPKGTERFFTGKKTTTEGTSMTFLPEKDRQYLSDRGLTWEEVVDGGSKGIILQNFNLPMGRFDVSTANILIVLPSGYPDVAPDMFYLMPWLKLLPNGALPRATKAAFSFQGQSWQRWSRHENEWRPGIDGIRTMLKRVEHALEVAA